MSRLQMYVAAIGISVLVALDPRVAVAQQPSWVPIDIGAEVGGVNNEAKDINNAGQVVGHIYIGAGYLPFLWTAAGPVSLGGGSAHAFTGASASNDVGQVVGRIGSCHAFMWIVRDAMVGDGQAVWVR